MEKLDKKMPHLYKKFFSVLWNNNIKPKDIVRQDKVLRVAVDHYKLSKKDLNKVMKELSSKGIERNGNKITFNYKYKM